LYASVSEVSGPTKVRVTLCHFFSSPSSFGSTESIAYKEECKLVAASTKKKILVRYILKQVLAGDNKLDPEYFKPSHLKYLFSLDFDEFHKLKKAVLRKKKHAKNVLGA
jgi:hypothetical protein